MEIKHAAVRPAIRLGVVMLVAGALVPLGTAAPAAAEPGCVDETAPNLLQDGCDDSTPPDTVVAASTTPNGAGLVSVSTMTFTVGVQVSDADPGPFGLECTLAGGPQAHDWRTCTSPVTYADLPDAPAGTYVFRARAVDLGDAGRDPDANPLPPAVADTPDHDPTPATVGWGQDTRAPFVFVTPTTYDEVTPTQPVVIGPSVPIRLNSSEAGSTIECTDNGRPVACATGRWELPDPAAGRHRFAARAVDAAGNAGAWSEPVEFFVPRDLTRRRGWTTVRDDGYFRGDALTTTRRGARLVLPRTKVGELRLLAPTRRGYGKVRVRVGRRAWHVVDLSGPRRALRQLVVIDRYSGLRSGRIVIESLSSRRVVVDAVVARPNRFPAATRKDALRLGT
ncbi:hypothetical protein GCM10011376_05400 [Nocardioides flavus (ex Wang et al. 2016)]|uniref:Ig-like domain (Group 3) n=1 Tax=Nocardioides flavus (ex Wang et al. 2016) TaxID=2058780 RepID=A0ABQ3HJ65_9ACTN|nr:hypothetical protein [Nocardioides flavus (ex Wang et al. 2016)]GHE15744.1 hypothetical protein GCM10011376_05400 [Nocardioides flavus (ex Wang et al. 2016)]